MSQRPLSLPESQANQQALPLVRQLTDTTVLTETLTPQPHRTGNAGVLDIKDVLCLPGCTVLTGAADICCFGTSRSRGGRLGSHVNKGNLSGIGISCSAATLRSSESGHSPTVPYSQTKAADYATCTKVLRDIDTDGLMYAQARGPNLKRSHLIRTPNIPTFSTLLRNAKIHPNKHHSIRLCHGHTSSSDPNAKQSTCLPNASKLDESTTAQLTHTDAHGRATMVDVGGKPPTRRTATARATVLLGPTAFRLLRDNQLAKGDALAVAQLAGIMASKQTAALIPLCHPLPLDHASVTFDLDEGRNAAVITATCRTTGRTGVEMEALTAVSVAALTLYDMCKAVSHDMSITDIELVSKTGGKRDFHRQS